jgi:hypothetical protein
MDDAAVGGGYFTVGSQPLMLSRTGAAMGITLVNILAPVVR